MLTMRIVTDPAELSAFAETFQVSIDEGVCLYLAENRGTVLGGCFTASTKRGWRSFLLTRMGMFRFLTG